MVEFDLGRMKKRLEKEYKHPVALALALAASALVALAAARVPVFKELRDLTFDSPVEEFDEAVGAAEQALARADQRLKQAIEADKSESSQEIAFVQHALRFLDGKDMLFEANWLIDYADRLEEKGFDPEQTAERPAESKRLAAEMAVTTGTEG